MAVDNKLRSPCIANCKLQYDDICQGCHRTLDELLDWSSASDQKKRDILARLSEIKQAKKKHLENRQVSRC